MVARFLEKDVFPPTDIPPAEPLFRISRAFARHHSVASSLLVAAWRPASRLANVLLPGGTGKQFQAEAVSLFS